jgi:hypothetical protein
MVFFMLIPVLSILYPGNKGRFLNLQRTLPTSKIRSVTMGLAEIEGKLMMIEPVITPIKKKECIGYHYKIEVNPQNIKLPLVEKDEQYSNSGKRYTQYVLYPNDKMLLIGKAGLKENNQPVFEYESIKKVFAISPSNKVLKYNLYKPLLNSFILFTCFFGLMTALILITPVEIKDNRLIIGNPGLENPFKDINSLDDFHNSFENQEEQEYNQRKNAFTNNRRRKKIQLIEVTMVIWVTGFITQMIFLFSGVSGLRMLLIWMVMFFTYLVFVIANKKMIQKWVEDISPIIMR